MSNLRGKSGGVPVAVMSHVQGEGGFRGELSRDL